jgi:transcriptional regulator with XRE-family HTH domain
MIATSYVFMSKSVTPRSQVRQPLLPFSGIGRFNGLMTRPDVQLGPFATALESVGPRLRKVREQRGVTLTDVSGRTGISKSTLSRLENGQRKPSLELLLPLAQLYRVPLEELVGAPEVGDPRIRLRPRRVNGRTVLPLTHPGGIQAWKIVIPKSQSTPKLRTHDGYEWLYVLTGRMRLIQGDQDILLESGEAAEFDTRIPHWFGSTGAGPAEVLSIFGRPGERMQLRSGAREDAQPH